MARTDVFERATATSLVLLPSNGGGLKLNGPAAVIWELTRRGATADEIARDAASSYGVDPNAILPFVNEILEALSDAGVVAEQ